MARSASSRKDAASFDFAEDDDDEGGGFNAAFLDEGDDGDQWEDDEGEESDDDSLAGQAVVTVRTAMMNVKRASIVALGNLAEYTEGLFAPHLENALQCLKVLVDLVCEVLELVDGEREAEARHAVLLTVQPELALWDAVDVGDHLGLCAPQVAGGPFPFPEHDSTIGDRA